MNITRTQKLTKRNKNPQPSLDQAIKQALRAMIAFICARTNLSKEQVYMVCSLVVDFHVTKSVAGKKGIHGMLSKAPLI
jgi:acetamidase/formamidase